MGISLEDAKVIIEKMQEVEKSKSDILTILPEVYKGYDLYAVTNYLLQMSFNDKHYYDFIKDRLLDNVLFKPFKISIEVRGIKLEHEKAHSYIYSYTKTVLKISCGDKTYDSSYFDEHKEYYLKNDDIITFEKEEEKEETHHDRLMGSVVQYIENPTFKSRQNIFRMSLSKDEKSLKNYYVSFRNMFASEKVLKAIYDRYISELEYDKQYKEGELERRKEYDAWVENEFPIIVEDTEKVIQYLQKLGYTQQKDI